MCLDLPDLNILQFRISKTVEEAKRLGVYGMNYAHPSIIYIITKHYINKFVLKLESFKRQKIVLFGVSLLTGVIFLASYIQKINFNSWYRFSLNIPDQMLILENYKEAITFLKNNLNKDEYFFTMTSEASWYYFLDKPCPTRFPVVWFAMTNFYQKEIIKDLQEKNVKFITYKHSYRRINGQTPEEMLPILSDYIKKNFVFCKLVGDTQIYCLNSQNRHK
jgi:hypothetical protein